MMGLNLVVNKVVMLAAKKVAKMVGSALMLAVMKVVKMVVMKELMKVQLTRAKK